MKRHTISRKLSPEWKRAIRPHALTTGHVVWASNYLHTHLHIVFMFVVGHKETAIGMWHSLRNDKPQLELLQAAIEATPHIGEADKVRLTWIVKKAISLGEKRNDLVHLPTTISIKYTSSGRMPLSVSPTPVATPPGRLERVENPRWRASLRLLIGDLIALARYAGVIWQRLGEQQEHRRQIALPQRPRLLLAPDMPKKKLPKHRAPRSRP
jgi:hypothetical protein